MFRAKISPPPGKNADVEITPQRKKPRQYTRQKIVTCVNNSQPVNSKGTAWNDNLAAIFEATRNGRHVHMRHPKYVAKKHLFLSIK
jgi:hypothetical protein